jgi:hypothetical protein
MQYAVLVLSDGSAAQRNTRHKEIERTLGLEQGRFGQIIHALCEDLLMGAHGSGGLTGSVDDASLASLMAEVACLPLHLAEPEAVVLAAAHRHWQISAVPHASANVSPMALAA